VGIIRSCSPSIGLYRLQAPRFDGKSGVFIRDSGAAARTAQSRDTARLNTGSHPVICVTKGLRSAARIGMLPWRGSPGAT